MEPVFSGSGEASGEEPEVGDEKPGEFRAGGRFEVSGEAPASAEPCEGAFDDPALGQELEAFDPRRRATISIVRGIRRPECSVKSGETPSLKFGILF